MDAERIAGGLLAYACGDAYGLGWEGKAPAEIDPAPPSGATSDDTALTFLVAEHVARGPAAFMAALVERAPSIYGLGPSTRDAIARFRQGLPAKGGNTNGALMRSLPLGWARRRTLVVEFSRVTHTGAEAICAAWVGAACAEAALDGAPLVAVARAEAARAVAALDADPRILGVPWAPEAGADLLDPYETLSRVLWCAHGELPEGLDAAVRLGGDTDTVAALVGGLLGCRLTLDEVRAQLPWSERLELPDLRALARALA